MENIKATLYEQYKKLVKANLSDFHFSDDEKADVATQADDMAKNNGDRFCLNCVEFYSVDKLRFLGNDSGEYYCPKDHILGNY